MIPPDSRTDRRRFAVLAAVTIVAGLAVHLSGRPLPGAVRDFAGDALWATMMAWWVGVVAPRTPVAIRAAVAYTLCVMVEFSQLLHTPVLDALRAVPGGYLVLGSGFDPRDLLAYLGGVMLAVIIEIRIATRMASRARGG